MRKLSVVAALLLLLPAVSQAKTLEDLLVEKGLITKGEAQASQHNGASKVYWKGGTRLDFPDNGFTAKINTDLQTRYEFTDGDKDAGAGNTSSFEVNRARLTVSGSALHEEFEYKLQVEFKGSSSSKLRDAWLQWNACDWSSLKMGQFKSQYARQNYNSGTKLLFPDRSVVTEFFAIDRNQGLSGQFDVNDDIYVTAEIFNGLSDGEGRNSTGMDTKHLGVISARANLMGEIDPFSEGDVEWTEEAGLNAGVAAAFGNQENAGLPGSGSADTFGLSADLTYKSEGLSFQGEFFYQDYDPDGESLDGEGIGFYAQVGYFLEPKQWELALRYGYIDCDNGLAVGNDIDGGACAGNDDINAIDVGVNYYWWKHNLKAQFAWSFIDEDQLAGGAVDDIQTNRWIFQLASYF